MSTRHGEQKAQIITTQQEQFVIHEETSPQRRKIVRQDRIPVPPGKCFLVYQNERLEIMNISSFGLAVIAKEHQRTSITQAFQRPSGVLVSIFFNDFEVQNVVLRLVRVEKHPESVFNDYIFGFEATGTVLATEAILALELADSAITSCNEVTKMWALIPKDFKLIVFELKEFLSQLKQKMTALEANAPKDNAVENRNFREAIAQSVAEFLSREIPQKYHKIPEALVGSDSKVIEISSQFIRDQLGPLIYGAPFAHRAYNKPLGYAGDFEMMNHLYRDEMVGSSLFDQCMHKYFIDEPAGQAVKNRGFYLLEKIRDVVKRSENSTVRILAVASGPAMEIQLFLKESKKFPGRKIEFVCIDQDSESLKHAQREILASDRFLNTGYEFKFINLAIKNILTHGLPDGNFDLVYSAGLFDYFTDPVAEMAGRRLFEGVAPGGSLIIGNFSTENPTQALMEVILEWHLIYRSKGDLERLFGKIGTSIAIEQEKLGINLFAIIGKSSE